MSREGARSGGARDVLIRGGPIRADTAESMMRALFEIFGTPCTNEHGDLRLTLAAQCSEASKKCGCSIRACVASSSTRCVW